MNELKNKIKQLDITLAGRFLNRFIPYRRAIIKANINQVFGDQLNHDEKNRLIKAFYSHLATSIREGFQLRFMTEKKLCEQVEVRGIEYMLQTVAKNKGVLVLTGHFGNWEFAPIGGVLNFKQFQGQFHFIRRTIGSKQIEKILFRRYYQAGLNIIPKKNSLQQVCDALDQNHAVIFVMDQHASLVNRDGVAVEFFGKKAGTYRSLASLSCNTGVPVVPAASFRLPDGRHVLEFFKPLEWQEYETRKESIYQNTLRYNQALEAMVLAHPEQWLWLHKRWKLKD
ncbi:MAG: lysophospholipid acyltransferase family protein [Tatlockia sp.]|nr:lysophospholipid acyltransferase family protein [Tatlockia sp.]